MHQGKRGAVIAVPLWLRRILSASTSSNHSAAPEFLDNPVVRDGPADHWRESCEQERIKSMKAEEMAISEHPFVPIDKDLSMIYFAM